MKLPCDAEQHHHRCHLQEEQKCSEEPVVLPCYAACYQLAVVIEALLQTQHR